MHSLRTLGLATVIGVVACNPATTPLDREMCHLGQATTGARRASWRELVEDPVAFEGQTVRIVGRLHLRFESYSLAPPSSTGGLATRSADLGFRCAR